MAPFSVSWARMFWPDRFGAMADGRNSAKPSWRSAKLLSDRSTPPFTDSPMASPESVPERSALRSLSTAVRSMALLGPSRLAVAPLTSRANFAGPLTVKVPSRAVSASRANSCPPKSASNLPFHAFQSPLPSTRTASGWVSPPSLASTPPRGASSRNWKASLFVSGTASSTSLTRSPPARPCPATAEPSNQTCARPEAICARPSSRNTRRSPETGASAMKLSTRSLPMSMSRSGSSGPSSVEGLSSGARRRIIRCAVSARTSTWFLR